MARKRPIPSDGKRAVKNANPGICEICGYGKFAQKHRIIPGVEGGKYRKDNVAYLCPNCHWESDHKLISREFLFDLIKVRLDREQA